MKAELTFEEFANEMRWLSDTMAYGHPVELKHNRNKGVYTARICGVLHVARPGSRMVSAYRRGHDPIVYTI